MQKQSLTTNKPMPSLFLSSSYFGNLSPIVLFSVMQHGMKHLFGLLGVNCHTCVLYQPLVHLQPP